MLTAICDQCEHRFPLPEPETRGEGEIREVGFACPECDHWYCAAKTNVKIRALADEIQGLRQECELIRSQGRHPKWQLAELQKKIARYRREMDRLNGRR